MTTNIPQNVIPRHRRGRKFNGIHLQRGNISHATITTTLGLFALVLLAMLGFFYLQQVLGTASQGTDIAELESQLIELKQRHRDLELKGAQLRSLQTVESRVQKLNLVTSNQVTYLPPAPAQVAYHE